MFISYGSLHPGTIYRRFPRFLLKLQQIRQHLNSYKASLVFIPMSSMHGLSVSRNQATHYILAAQISLPQHYEAGNIS